MVFVSSEKDFLSLKNQELRIYDCVQAVRSL